MENVFHVTVAAREREEGKEEAERKRKEGKAKSRGKTINGQTKGRQNEGARNDQRSTGSRFGTT